MLSSGCGSKPAFRSAPEENPRPAPVISTARTDGSAASSFTACLSSAPNSAVQAFSVSGRFSVIRPMPPDCCHWIVA